MGLFRKGDDASIDAGARARLQAKAAQVAASVYTFWDQGISVDVTYADGRVERDNTLFGVVENSLLEDGRKFHKGLKDQRGRSYHAVVSGDAFVRLVLQPSPDRLVRTFNKALPAKWIGSIALVPKTEKKLIGLLRLRPDILPDRNKRLVDRATRLFIMHSGGVDVRDMTEAEATEYATMLPPHENTAIEEPNKTPWQKGKGAFDRQEVKRQQDERRYEDLLNASASKQEMPFHAWASKQPEEDLWKCSPQELLVHLDREYGGPNVVDAFHLRGMKHALRTDIFSVKERVTHSQLSGVDEMVLLRVLERQGMAKGDARDREALKARLNELAEVAERLGIADLANEYWDEAWLC